MMTDKERIAAAEEAVDIARERFVDTVQDLALQLEPRRLVRELWEDAKDKGADLAGEAVDAVKSRPIAATGVAAAVAMFLAREPLGDLASKLIGGKKKAKSNTKSRTTAEPKEPRASSATSKKPRRTRQPASTKNGE